MANGANASMRPYVREPCGAAVDSNYAMPTLSEIAGVTTITCAEIHNEAATREMRLSPAREVGWRAQWRGRVKRIPLVRRL